MQIAVNVLGLGIVVNFAFGRAKSYITLEDWYEDQRKIGEQRDAFWEGWNAHRDAMKKEDARRATMKEAMEWEGHPKAQEKSSPSDPR